MKRALVALGALFLSACSGGSRSSPTSPTTARIANVTVSAVSVRGERTATGFSYTTTTFRVQETGGVAATIATAELTFAASGVVFGSVRFENPLVTATNNKVAANGSADSKILHGQ